MVIVKVDACPAPGEAAVRSPTCLFCAIAGSACIAFLFDKPWWIGIPLGVLVAMCATIGDLMESVIKRDLGIKDMSNLLPGHGGLMDRLDSLLVCSPVVWAVLHYLVAA